MTNEHYPLTIGGEQVPDEACLLATVEDGDTMRTVRYLIVHCSATPAHRPYPVEALERDHRARGFRTVGYHFYIRRDGTLTQHRPLLGVGAHCRPWNRCSIGICYEGGIAPDGTPADTRTPAQAERLGQLLGQLLRVFPGALIRGHRDMPDATPKACPCFDAGQEYGYLYE